jgi:predicted nucleotidyltransferase
MFAKNTYIGLLQDFMLFHAAEYGITRMGIFGSVARGEEHESSDVDICIEAPPMGFFALSGLHLALEELLGAPVDVIRMRTHMNPRLRERIENEVVYV